MAALLMWSFVASLLPAALSLSPGLYGFDGSQACVYFFKNGTSMRIGPGVNSSRYVLSEGLSTIDTPSATLYAIGLDKQTNSPVLFSIPLSTGAPSAAIALPFGEVDDAIGAGQVIAFAADAGLVIVGGVGVGGSTILATVDPFTQNVTVFAALPANVSVSLDTSQAAYFPSTKTLVVLVTGVAPPYARLIAAVSLPTGGVELLPNGHEPNVNTLDYDVVTGDVFGLGTSGSNDDDAARVTVRVSPDLKVTVVGSVHGYSDSLGGFSALDSDSRSIYWLGAESGNDDGFYVLNVALTRNATVLSAGLACASSLSPSCPLTFEYYHGSGMGH